MMIIGCDYHPSWQQICWLDTETGETGEQKLDHALGEAEKFYRRLPAPALMGMESTGNCQWFVEMATTGRGEVATYLVVGDGIVLSIQRCTGRQSPLPSVRHKRGSIQQPQSSDKIPPE